MADCTDDFDFIGAVTDDFDCDATTNWVAGASVVLTQEVGVTQVANTSVGIEASATGVRTVYHNVPSGSRFKVTEKLVNFWFYYIKGKGAAYLTQDSTAVVVRLYFDDGTTYNKYADYRVTDRGDLELNFGWNQLSFSGKEMNGGVVGGTHNNGTDWELDIIRVELRLNFANDNSGNGDSPLRMDNWEIGTKITLIAGTPSVPLSFTDIQDYSNDITGLDRTNGPLGLVTVRDVFIDCKCALDIGNGSDGVGNEGNLIEESKFILFNQWSEEVKCHLTVTNYSSAIFGTLEVGTDGNYATNGCQLVLPPSRYSDIDVKNGGVLKIYDGKIYRWRYLYLGAASDTLSTIDLQQCDVDSCETVYCRANTLDLSNIEIHDGAAQVNDFCATIEIQPDTFVGIRVYTCTEGIHFRETVSVADYTATDNTTYDLVILEGKTLTIKDSVFSENKIGRVAT